MGRVFPFRQMDMTSSTGILSVNPETIDARIKVRSQAMAPEVGAATGTTGDHERPVDQTDWAQVVERIRQGDERAMEELYAYFGKGVRYFLLRRLGVDELEDRVHDVFLVVAAAIQNGELRDPSRLMGFVRTVVRRAIAGVIQDNVTSRVSYMDLESLTFSVADWRLDPEKTAQQEQRTEVVRRLLQGASRRDREVLRRFYMEEQSQEQICAEMGLSYNQFRLLKSRAKARFSEMGQRMAGRLGLTIGQKN